MYNGRLEHRTRSIQKGFTKKGKREKGEKGRRRRRSTCVDAEQDWETMLPHTVYSEAQDLSTCDK